MSRLRVAVLGATGAVGQKLVLRLAAHPWFEIGALVASERSAGRRYGEVVHWLEAEPLPAAIAAMTVEPPQPLRGCDLAISAVDAAIARELEPAYARAGCPVVSNASVHRMEEGVPLLVPEVNPDHVDLVGGAAGSGFIVTNPNCVTAGLVIVLRPLLDAFGLEAVQVTTMQAASGAGYPGVPSLDLLGNVIPFIAGEEEKIAAEPRKILGRLEAGRLIEASFAVSAQATRVPVLDGHVLSLSLRFSRRASPEEVCEALECWRNPITDLHLPSAPARPLVVLSGEAAPQPRLHAGLGGGMTVAVGRVRRCPVLHVRLVALVHNTIRGAAGGALVNAELLAKRGLLATPGHCEKFG